MKTDKTTQDHVLQFIVDFKTSHDGLSPTFQEIREACHLVSKSTVYYHIRNLEKDGLIKTLPQGASRGIIVIGGLWTGPA